MVLVDQTLFHQSSKFGVATEERKKFVSLLLQSTAAAGTNRRGFPPVSRQDERDCAVRRETVGLQSAFWCQRQAKDPSAVHEREERVSIATMVLTTIYGAAPSDVQLWPFKVLSGAKGEPEFEVQFMKEGAGRFHLDGISFIVHGTTMEATTTDFHGFEVMTMVRRLAKEEHQGKIGFCFADNGTVREDWSQQLLFTPDGVSVVELQRTSVALRSQTT